VQEEGICEFYESLLLSTTYLKLSWPLPTSIIFYFGVVTSAAPCLQEANVIVQF